jgi:gliding motility-associated lipoprotein GldB
MLLIKLKMIFKINLFFIISFLFMSCTQENKKDISKIAVEVTLLRFDKDLAQINPNELPLKLPLLKKKYGVFYDDYFEKILNLGSTQDTSYYHLVREVLNGRPFQDLQHETDSIYPTLENLKPQFVEAFKRIKYEYPKWKAPKLIAYISGFQVQTPIGSGYVGIGLDMFLGPKSKFYPALVESVPHYISRRFTTENIVPRVVEVISREELFPESDKDKNLLAKMIYHGKVLYLMKELLPNTADSTLIGYSEEQLNWAQQFESDIWAFFLEQDLLFNSDYLKIQKYLAEAPFTPGLGDKNNSAPKLGLYIGWQIVNKFMDENPKTNLHDLMLMDDAQKILRLAKYHPSNLP